MNTNRNEWSMVRVAEKMPDKDGLVTPAKLHIGRKKNSDQTLIRPITKVMFLVRNEDLKFPDRET